MSIIQVPSRVLVFVETKFAALKAENENLLAANRDCILHFNCLKEDYDKLKAELEALRNQEPVAYIDQKFVLDSDGRTIGVSNRKLLRFGKPHRFAQCTPLFLAAGAKEKHND